MEEAFGNSRIVSILGLSLFVIGIALGPMLFGPLSEFYGRRPIYLVAWSMYVIWIIPQTVAKNAATLLVGRFLDGFAGSTFLAVSGGTVGDLFSGSELQKPMAMFTISPFLGPTLGPVIGGFINYNVDWRWTYYVLLIWGVVELLCIVFLVPETYRKSWHRHRAAQCLPTMGANTETMLTRDDHRPDSDKEESTEASRGIGR
jgi:multidrug resistance protein